MSKNENNLRPGISGIMRVKNDGCFIEACVESCIDALDELIIVWNDCTDNSADEIEKVRQRYPDKIRTYEYKYKVYSVGLTKEEYEYAKSLPKDSPHLLCNYYNFALSKVTCQYALKIDADQIYVTNKLKTLCDSYRCKNKNQHMSIIEFLSFHFIWYYRKLDFKLHNRLKLPCTLKKILYKKYLSYIYKLIERKKVCTSLSGINVFYKDDKWYIPLGAIGEKINILPPFNGVNDHLLFKVSKDTYYEPFESTQYNNMRSETYSLIETFKCPYKLYNVGYFWYHLNQNRLSVRNKIYDLHSTRDNLFVEKDMFFNMDFDVIKNKIPNALMDSAQKVLFSVLFDGEKTSRELVSFIDGYVIDGNGNASKK